MKQKKNGNEITKGSRVGTYFKERKTHGLYIIQNF